MERRGQSIYDEAVTQLEHALQCAHQAQQAGADSVQVAAALLHDLGHFLVDEHNEEADFLTEDFLHEKSGSRVSGALFLSTQVIEPVGLHDAGLSAISARWIGPIYQTLSRASKRSFELQGGFMSGEEKAAFERNLHWESAVQLRKWDDLAKEKDLTTPGLESHRAAVQGCLK